MHQGYTAEHYCCITMTHMNRRKIHGKNKFKFIHVAIQILYNKLHFDAFL